MTSDSLQAHEPIMAENYFYFMVLCLNKLINFHDTFQYGNVINFHLIARFWYDSIYLSVRLHTIFIMTFLEAFFRGRSNI